MDIKMIETLREALKVSPNNIPLKYHLAETLLNFNMLEEAEKEYRELTALDTSNKPKLGIAKVFYAQGDYAKCNVVLEELARNSRELEVLVLHTRALVKENNIAQAILTYQNLLDIYPDFKDDELDAELRVSGQQNSEFEDSEMNAKFIQNPGINFDDVGGMTEVKKEIDLKIIQPLKHPELYKSYGKKVGGGILLYGPPGCGKTYLAKATAGQVNAKFINVSLNSILDMWIGNSEKNLHEIFELARKNTPCVLFFDEVDALGASRSDLRQSAGRQLINQFLQELDGLESDNEGILIIGATNTPWHLDPAFRRPGRFDRILFIPPPDESARASIFKLKLNSKPTDNINYADLAKISKSYSGADVEAAVDIAVEGKLEDALKTGVPKPIETKDMKQAIKKHKATTTEWFSTARNFALYANEAGLYDDILEYMNIKK